MRLPSALLVVTGLTTGCLFTPRLVAGENYALLVAVGDYDVKELRPLKYTRADVLEFRQALVDSGFPEKNVVLMHDDLKQLVSHYEKLGGGRDPKNFLPLRANVSRQLELLLGRLRPDDSVIVAFSGHGVQFKGEKKSYFCPADANLERKESLIAFEDVFTALKECSAGRKLFLVDACQNDPLTALSKSRSTVDLESVTRPQTEAVPEGIIALFSCRAGQKSYEMPDLGHGVFFYHLLEGWKGKADSNGDGKLSYQELAVYTEKQTAEFAAVKLQTLQTPQLKADFSGEWVLRTIGGARGFVPLFNGRDLSGWVVASGERNAWRVERDELVVTGSVENRGWLMTDRDYADYTLRLEFQLSAAGNSGVALHAQPGDKSMAEIQILDEAAYPNLTAATKTGALFQLAETSGAKLRPLGEWNRMEVDVRGRAVRISINGDTVTRIDLALLVRSDNPAVRRARGRIGLQNWQGGTVRFRNIELQEHGFASIFNGQNLAGWTVDRGDTKAWRVQDGAIVMTATPQDRGWLMSERDYGEFAVRFEFQAASAGANSGFTFHARNGEGTYGPDSTPLPEIQLQDETFPNYASLPAVQKTGALYKVATTRPSTLAPLREWNDAEVEVRRGQLSVTINGVLTTSVRLDDLPAAEKARIPGLGRAAGRIGFQNWDGEFRFRNVRIKTF